MKLLKGVLEILATLIYVFLFTIFMYMGYAGWFKILPIPRLKEDDAPLIATVINFLYLVILFILSLVTDGIVQDNFITFLCYNIVISIVIIFIGALLYLLIPETKN